MKGMWFMAGGTVAVGLGQAALLAPGTWLVPCEPAPVPKPEGETPTAALARELARENAEYRWQNFKLRCQLAAAQAEADALRRQQMARPPRPCEPDDVPPGDRIPPQQVPVTPAKE